MSQRASEPLTPEQFEELLGLSADRLGFSTHASWTHLARYLSALTRWRRSMNLTGDLSPQDLAEHALESVLGANLIIHGARVIDIGSGAGFPGLPIAASRADVKMSLLEPRAKRAAFLRYVVRDLRLSKHPGPGEAGGRGRRADLRRGHDACGRQPQRARELRFAAPGGGLSGVDDLCDRLGQHPGGRVHPRAKSSHPGHQAARDPFVSVPVSSCSTWNICPS